jgi:hypothetical protein
MQYKITYLPQEEVTIIITFGKMTAEGFTEMAKDILNHPNYKPNNNTLFDHRELDYSATAIEDLNKIRDFHRQHENEIGNGKSAMLIKSIPDWNRLWSQGEKIETANQVQLFEDLNSAISWLQQ